MKVCLFCWSKDDPNWEVAKVNNLIDHMRAHHRIFMNQIKILPIPEHAKKDFYQFGYSNPEKRFLHADLYAPLKMVAKMEQLETHKLKSTTTLEKKKSIMKITTKFIR